MAILKGGSLMWNRKLSESACTLRDLEAKGNEVQLPFVVLCICL